MFTAALSVTDFQTMEYIRDIEFREILLVNADYLNDELTGWRDVRIIEYAQQGLR